MSAREMMGTSSSSTTRVTIDDAYSYHPSITVDTEGHTHIVWMDGRDYGMAQDANYEVYYTKLNLRGAGDWNGASGGLSTYAIKEIEDTRISDSCETNPNYPASSPFPCVPPQGRAYGGNSVFPAILSDSQDKIHIAWHEFGNATANEEIAYVRLNATDATGAGVTALDPWEIVEVTSWESDKLGPNTGGNRTSEHHPPSRTISEVVRTLHGPTRSDVRTNRTTTATPSATRTSSQDRWMSSSTWASHTSMSSNQENRPRTTSR